MIVCAKEDALAKVVQAAPGDVADAGSLRRQWAEYAVRTMAERRAGEDPHKSLEMIERYQLSREHFPRVLYLKAKDCVWWAIRSGLWTEYAELLCGKQSVLLGREVEEALQEQETETGCYGTKLRRYACRQLAQRGKQQDGPGMFAAHVHQYGLQEEGEFAELLQQARGWVDPAGGGDEPAEGGAIADDVAETPAPLSMLQMPADDIVWVDSPERVAEAKAELLAAECVGLDMEAMPSNFNLLHGLSTQSQVLQLATDRRVFCVDLQYLHASTLAGDTRCDDMLRAVAVADGVRKLGMGWANDIKQLRQDFPLCVAFRETLNYVELTGLASRLPTALLHKRALEAPAQPRPRTGKGGYNRGGGHGAEKESGLGKLARLVLGVMLSKKMQMSNWGVRPLSPAQLQYAALDALVEVQMYKAVAARLKEQGGEAGDINQFFEPDDVY